MDTRGGVHGGDPFRWLRRHLGLLVLHAGLIAAGMVVLVPIAWMFITSLKERGEMFLPGLHFWPTHLDFSHYRDLFVKYPFLRWCFNSVFVAAGASVLGTIISSLAGFAFAKYTFRGKNLLFGVLLLSFAIPQIVTIIPMFALLSRIHWLNTYQALILPSAVSAFGIFYMRSYIAVVPNEMLDAGRMNGATEFQLYHKIVLPVIRPALAALVVIIFLDSWIAYLWPLIMMRSPEMFTLPLGLVSLYANPWARDFGLLMAGAFLATLPLAVVFLIMQREYVTGTIYGALQ